MFLGVVIANGAAGSSSKDVVEEVAKALSYEIRWTSVPGEGALLASRSLDEGFQSLAVCGGDGSINEVLSGVMKAQKSCTLG